MRIVVRQQVAFDLTRKVARGETIHFVVSTGSACSYLATGLKEILKGGWLEAVVGQY